MSTETDQMAQLGNEKNAANAAFLTLADAEAEIAKNFDCVVERETVPLAQANGRILAETIISRVSIPQFDNSAVDGYAFRFSDLDVDCSTDLALSGREAAGRPSGNELAPGSAVRIFTGALMPDGADTVAMQEDVVLHEDHVTIPNGLKFGDNQRLRGEDVALDQSVLDAGTRVGPAEMALLGALGLAQVKVRKSLKAALFSTGDEVIEPGEKLKPGQLFDANRFLLGAMLQKLGVECTDCGILPDSRSAITEMLAGAAKDHDVVITSGGVSMGDEDHIKAAIDALGSIQFWKVAMKPGRPVALGLIANKPLIGLPGNPGAAMITFAMVARRVIERLSGGARMDLPRFTAQSEFQYKKKAGRREFIRANLTRNGDRLSVDRHPKPGAGTISSLVESDALIELPEECSSVKLGDMLDVIPMKSLFD